MIKNIVFQHTAARRRLQTARRRQCNANLVSTHSRAEAAASSNSTSPSAVEFQHTAARRRLQYVNLPYSPELEVSTHSRAEAAAIEPSLFSKPINVSTHSRAEAAAPYLKKQEKSAD